MKAITIKEILDSCNGKFIGAEEKLNTRVTSIVTDSRQAKENSMFVAIKGEKVDGHKFVPMTYSQGAVCALVEEKVDVNKTATRWKNIEDLLTNGTFDYNGKTITETDTENNVITHSQTN